MNGRLLRAFEWMFSVCHYIDIALSETLSISAQLKKKKKKKKPSSQRNLVQCLSRVMFLNSNNLLHMRDSFQTCDGNLADFLKRIISGYMTRTHNSLGVNVLLTHLCFIVNV